MNLLEYYDNVCNNWAQKIDLWKKSVKEEDPFLRMDHEDEVAGSIYRHFIEPIEEESQFRHSVQNKLNPDSRSTKQNLFFAELHKRFTYYRDSFPSDPPEKFIERYLYRDFVEIKDLYVKKFAIANEQDRINLYNRSEIFEMDAEKLMERIIDHDVLVRVRQSMPIKAPDIFQDLEAHKLKLLKKTNQQTPVTGKKLRLILRDPDDITQIIQAGCNWPTDIGSIKNPPLDGNGNYLESINTRKAMRLIIEHLNRKGYFQELNYGTISHAFSTAFDPYKISSQALKQSTKRHNEYDVHLEHYLPLKVNVE